MKKDQLLAIDNGTQSVRALIYNADGELLHKAQITIEPYFSRRPGWAEQDPEVYWQAACDACQQLWREGADPDRIAGMAVTTQRATMVNLGADNQPVRPAITWLDQRQCTDKPKIKAPWPLLFKLAGVTDLIDYAQRNAKLNWLIQHEPDSWAKTAKYLQLSGFLTFRLTGKFVDSTGSQVAYQPFDYKKRNWPSKHHWAWQAMPVRREQMPDLVLPGTTIGPLTGDAAEATGIPAGTPLIAAAADKACEIIGAGGLKPGVGCLSYGTTATYNVMTKKYVEPVKLLPPYPAAVPDYYYTEVQVFRGYWMVSWFKKQFGHREMKLAEEQGVAPESLFDELIKDIPAGSMGLMLQPYWTPGVRQPGPEAKGSIIGFGDVHTRAHIYRAILEGLAYALREGKEGTDKVCPNKITELRVSGGGSQSDQAMQLTADIFGLPAVRPANYEASGLGAVMAVAVGLGWQPDFASAAEAMTKDGDRFEPNPAVQGVYDKLYRKVYQKMYGQLAGLYKDIREITGYPA